MDAIFDNLQPNGCCSLRKTVDGGYVRLAVVPGDWAAVEAFAPELVPALQAVWTDEVIRAYRDYLDSLPPEEPVEPADPGKYTQAEKDDFLEGLMEGLGVTPA